VGVSSSETLGCEESGAASRTIRYRSQDGTDEEEEDDACSVATKKARTA